MDASGYQDALLRLLPPGRALSRDPAGQLGLLFLALADEFARLDGRLLALIEEADPRTTDEMLEDWERVAGLPDPAIPTPVTLPDRRAALAARLLSRSGVTEADFIALAASQGVPATITTHVPFAADVSAADDLLYDDLSRFWWEMVCTVPTGMATPIAALEHVVRRLAPDHTYVTFTYLFV